MKLPQITMSLALGDHKLNITEKIHTAIARQNRKAAPMVAAQVINEHLSDKSIGYAIAAVPDNGGPIYIRSCTGLLVREDCVPAMLNTLLEEHPNFKGTIYSDSTFGAMMSKFGAGSKLIYETALA